MLRFQSEIFCSLLANALKDHSTMRNTFTKRTFRSDCEGRCASSAHFHRFTSIEFSLETQTHLPPSSKEKSRTIKQLLRRFIALPDSRSPRFYAVLRSLFYTCYNDVIVAWHSSQMTRTFWSQQRKACRGWRGIKNVNKGL